ncbi:cell wall hydrolase [Bengtsoniella intestinalis]|uniref:cell wall hydrolase n=1 Tax=Bengtsoniella intestinalis TaxID=3073143 RepID=UPI00391F710E
MRRPSDRRKLERLEAALEKQNETLAYHAELHETEAKAINAQTNISKAVVREVFPNNDELVRRKSFERRMETHVKTIQQQVCLLSLIAVVALAIAVVLVYRSTTIATQEVSETAPASIAVAVADDALPVAQDIEDFIEPHIVDIDHEPTVDDQAIPYLAKLIWGEARGCTQVQQEAVVWCVLNRVDSDDPYYPDDIIGVITQESQFHGYADDNPIYVDFVEIATDVLEQWEAEKSGSTDVERAIPVDCLWFWGDGDVNYYRTAYNGGDTYTV